MGHIFNDTPHNLWHIDWEIYKWKNSYDKELGKPADEVFRAKKNILLCGGVSEFLKLLSGTGGIPYNAENTRIYVGDCATVENFYQTGIIATGDHCASAKLDGGYPYVDGNKLFYQASFGNDDANFMWNEVSITNGDFKNSIALNRKEEFMGYKQEGTWTIRVTISITGNRIDD